MIDKIGAAHLIQDIQISLVEFIDDPFYNRNVFLW